MRVCLLTEEIIEEFNPARHLKSHNWDYVTVLSPAVEFIGEYSRSRQYDVCLNIYEGQDGFLDRIFRAAIKLQAIRAQRNKLPPRNIDGIFNFGGG